MKSFDKIEALARKHHGGPKGVTAKLAEWSVDTDLTRRKDDRFLSEMASALFSSGFSWTVIQKKWPGFETAFERFAPKRVAAYGDEEIDRLLKDAAIVRNGAKIVAVIENARFVVATANQYGSFGNFLAAWPAADQIGLMDHLKKHGSRLGGATAMYFLRFSGWDAFITSQDVTRALIREGVVERSPSTKAEWKAVQAAFNAWAEESGRPRREISRILALSMGPN